MITGGAGFVGSAVVAGVRAKGVSDVFVPRSAEYDLRDRDGVVRMFERARPDTLIHLAGVVGGIGANRANPGVFFYDNAIMGIQVVEEARRFGVEKTLVVGTVCAYPKYAEVPFREGDIWSGYPEETNAPYGLAKKMLLVQAQAYREQYGMNIIYLLPANTYGPGDNFEWETSHAMAALIRRFSEARDAGKESVTAWGTGKPTREFLYVDDAAEGILLALERYDKPEPVNLGSGREVSILELTEMIRNLVGFEGEVVWDTSKPDGQPRRNLDTSKAREQFGFVAKTPLEEGLARTVRWYEESRGRFAP